MPRPNSQELISLQVMKRIYWSNVCPLPKKIARYSGGNLLVCFEIVGKPDLQLLSTVKDMMTNNMEC